MKINDNKIKEFAYTLNVANNVNDVFGGWIRMNGDFEGFKAIVGLEEYNEMLISRDIIDKINDNDSGFVFYFSSLKLYFVNDMFMNKMINDLKVNISIDYSIMFDTNFASYIDKFVRNGNPGTVSNNVYSAIDLLIRNDYQYDYHIYLIENIKSINGYFEKYYYEFKLNDKMFENIVSLELFKSIKSDVYKKTGKVEYDISYNQAKESAIELIDMFYQSQESKSLFKYIIDLQKQILLLLIGMVKIHFSSKRSPQKKMEEFLGYIDKVSGIYFDREAIVAYEYFERNKNLKIFRKIYNGIDAQKLFKILDNIAWDFTIPRLMEHVIVTCGEGDFFIPILLTLDKDLRSLLEIYSVKGCIFNEKSQEFFPIPDKSSQEYFSQRKCVDFIENLMESQNRRLNILNNNRNNGYSILEDQFEQLKVVMCK